MNFVKKRLSSSPAAWKVMANQVMVMPTIYPGGDYIGFDSWQGYPRERHELLQHLRRKKIEDVVFVTGDIHTFVAGDVVDNDDKKPVATEFVGGSISRRGWARAGGGILPGGPVQPEHARGDHRPAQVDQPVGGRRRVRPPRLRAGRGDAEALQLQAAAREHDQDGIAQGVPDKRFSYRISRGEPSLLD